MTRDHFPTTHQTWLSEHVGVANDEVARHVMQRYFEPLRAYVKGSSLRNFGDSADLVNDFFAARLGDATYLERWIDSGLPLRRWLEPLQHPVPEPEAGRGAVALHVPARGGPCAVQAT